jgi:2-dehydro-3-deoxyphosphogluconate aldolase/(4S)-4-hydroxy-2-oxoglutarate aldolase
MDKELVLAKIKEQGIVAVVRGKDEQDGVRIADACIAGGVKAIEVAFTTPRAHECIKTLVDKYQGDKDVIIGAGTVLDAITARIAILEGAQFIVSPSFDLETVKLCNKYRVASMPGTSTMAGVLGSAGSRRGCDQAVPRRGAGREDGEGRQRVRCLRHR